MPKMTKLAQDLQYIGMNSYFRDSSETQRKVKKDRLTPCLAHSGAYCLGVEENTTCSGAKST